MVAVLGPEGGARLIQPGEGLSTALLLQSWRRAFAGPTAGGCPDAYGGSSGASARPRAAGPTSGASAPLEGVAWGGGPTADGIFQENPVRAA